MRQFLLTVALVLTVAVGVGAQDMPNVDQFGPQVGDVVPAFNLPDQTGQNRTLPSIMGPNGAMLVFSRSADW